MPDEHGLFDLDQIPGAILRVGSLHCIEDEGWVYDDQIYLEFSIDGSPRIPWPLTAAGRSRLESIVLGGVVGAGDITTWQMAPGDSEPVAFPPVAFTDRVDVWCYDRDTIDSTDFLGQASISLKGSVPAQLRFDRDGAHYLLDVEVVRAGDGLPCEDLRRLAKRAGVEDEIDFAALGCGPGGDPPTERNLVEEALEAVGGLVGSTSHALETAPVRYSAVWRGRDGAPGGRRGGDLSPVLVEPLAVERAVRGHPIREAVRETLTTAASEATVLDGLTWEVFTQRWRRLSDRGLRLRSISPYRIGDERRWAGRFAPGHGRYALYALDQPSFLAKHEELVASDHRLVDLATYWEHGRRMWAGVWEGGKDAHALLIDLPWDEFTSRWSALADEGVRLTAVQTYLTPGGRRWAGVFRAGDDAHSFLAGPWDVFESGWKEQSERGLRLVDLIAYEDGDRPCWAGVFRAGEEPHQLLVGLPPEEFRERDIDARTRGLELVSLEIHR